MNVITLRRGSYFGFESDNDLRADAYNGSLPFANCQDQTQQITAHMRGDPNKVEDCAT